MTTQSDRTEQILRDAGFPELADYQGMNRPDFRTLHHQARQIAYAEETAARELQAVRDRTARAQRDLETHTQHNSLGVLQGSALDVDRAVALLAERWSTFQLMTSTVDATLELERSA